MVEYTELGSHCAEYYDASLGDSEDTIQYLPYGTYTGDALAIDRFCV